MTSVLQLVSPVQGISCHAWNPSGDCVAICPNNNEIHLYKKSTTGLKNWECIDILVEHDLIVSSIDWSINNHIVTCSHDRNAFVWTLDNDNNKWKPTLVILQIDRGALHVRWSACGKKFAVASASKKVPICSYDSDRDWWISKSITKKFKSTVLCCAFHPKNSQLIATGSCDFRCRIYSTYSSDIDGQEVNSGPFKGAQIFGETYCEMTTAGWVNAVSWSPSGDYLAFASHDSTIHIAVLDGKNVLDVNMEPSIQRILHKSLPFTTLLFGSFGDITDSDANLIAAGHDFQPYLLRRESSSKNSWYIVDSIDKESEKSSTSNGSSNVAAARALFKAKSERGQDSAVTKKDQIQTKHASCISEMRLMNSNNNNTGASLSSSAYDGRLVLWNVESSIQKINASMTHMVI